MRKIEFRYLRFGSDGVIGMRGVKMVEEFRSVFWICRDDDLSRLDNNTNYLLFQSVSWDAWSSCSA